MKGDGGGYTSPKPRLIRSHGEGGIYTLLSCLVVPNPFHCYFFNLYIRYITQTSNEEAIIANDVPMMDEDWQTKKQKKEEKHGGEKQGKLSKGVSKYLVRSKVGINI